MLTLSTDRDSKRGAPSCLELRWFTDDVVGPAFVLGISACVFWTHRHHFTFDLFYFGCVIAFFAFLSLCLSLVTGRYFFFEEKIVHKNIFGIREMRWSEIQSIEGESRWETTRESLLLLGPDKQFVLSAPATWLGPNKVQILRLLRRKFSEHAWTLQPPRSGGSFSRSRNVKVPRKSSGRG